MFSLSCAVTALQSTSLPNRLRAHLKSEQTSEFSKYQELSPGAGTDSGSACKRCVHVNYRTLESFRLERPIKSLSSTVNPALPSHH